MLSASAQLYRRRAGVFLGIGSMFVLAGVIESFTQWVIFSTSFVDTVLGFFPARDAAAGVVALSIGNLESSIVYWMVATGSIAALARIERRRPNTPLEDYSDVLRQFWGLAIARLKALGIVVLLVLSVIGIPWAIWNGARWAFIEETILLDGTSSGQARAASGRAVSGHWWHTFLCLLVFSGLGYLTGPAVGIALLLLTSLPVSLVNLVSSGVFAAVVPFVAIGQALLYLNLTIPEQSRIGNEARA
jgi:hypothetical protein